MWRDYENDFGLDLLNLWVANIQTGFGPFVAVYLTSKSWTQTDIGLALSLGTLTALAGVIVLGPRAGKFRRDGTIGAIPGHNLPMAMIGTLILAFGWFGFNAGSTLAGNDPRLATIAVNTMLASSAGALTALVFVFLFGGPIIDTRDRRKLMVYAQFGSMAATGLLHQSLLVEAFPGVVAQRFQQGVARRAIGPLADHHQ